MARSLSTLARWSILAASLPLALGGCSEKTVGPEGPTYPDQSTPANVLEKIELAYGAMDVEAYMECLAGAFAFYLNGEDLGADPTLPEHWSADQELIVHESMFGGNPDVEGISLTLTVISADSLPGDDPVDPADDRWEYDTHIDLRIDSGLSYFATGRVLFVVGRAPGRAGTTWRVVEQRDLIQPQGWVQEMTLTRIKLAFGGDIQDSLYPIRTSPENALLKLELAYERMDAEAYLDCLAEDFLFYLNPDDLTGDPELPECWGKEIERAIHTAMFAETTVVEWVTLDMSTVSSDFDPGADPEDASDDRWTYGQDVDLRVALPPELTLHVAGYRHDFVLGIDPDEVSLTGALLWEIIEWHDTNYWPGGPMRRSGTTWGSIKALFVYWPERAPARPA
jgi:hypothetical protein